MAALRWSLDVLAEQSGLGRATIMRATRFDDVPPMWTRNVETIRQTFEHYGVTFLEDDGNGPGIRWSWRELD